ncbi:MAG: DNA internalization-related competence protein ComEC/Rec2 [Gaiellales bacterium]
MRRLIVHNWPALLVAAVAGGIALANLVSVGASVAWVAAAATCAVGLLAATGEGRLAALAFALAAVGLGWGGLRLASLDRSVLATRVGETASARVVVTGPAKRSRYALRIPALVTRFDHDHLMERVLLQLPPERAPPQGSVLELRAQPVEPRGPETGFDERRWLARQGVHVVLRGWRVRLVGRRGGIGGVADRLRAHVESTLASGTRGESRRLLVGVVLGADEGLTEELRDAFKASGLTHLLAVSGQNVVITAMGVVVAARIVGIGRIAGEGIAIVAVLAYALAAGWQPSVVRAAIAGIVASIAWISGRPRDRWYAMALGALVLLAWSPSALLEPGFQLSFAAVASIFLFVPRVQGFWEGYPVPAKLAELMSLAVVCAIATAPIIWLHFGSLALWTVPANMLAEPAMPPLVGLSLAAAAVAPLSPSAAASLAWLAGGCAAWIAWVARVFAGLPGSQLTSGWSALAIATALVGAMLLARLPRYRRRGVLAVVVPLMLLGVVGWSSVGERPSWNPPLGLRVSVLDVGQGDAILVEAPGVAFLVDQGPPEAHVARQLRAMGLRSLTAVVLTHPQRDHIGGAADVLRRLHVATVLDPDLPMPSTDETEARRVATEHEVPVTVVRAGDRFRVGRLRLDVLWPDGPGLPSEDPNLRATVVRVSYGDIDVLLTADAESDVTGRLALGRVEVLKVAHHGSRDPGLPDLLERLRPRVAVISVGAHNDYGHPTPETLADLAATPGLDVYRTDEDGRVVIESVDGRALTVRSER